MAKVKGRRTMAQIAREANRMAKHYFNNPYLSTKPPQAEVKTGVKTGVKK